MSIPQVYALTGLTVRKPMPEVKNPIGTADLEWIFARNCEGTERLRVIMKILQGGSKAAFRGMAADIWKRSVA